MCRRFTRRKDTVKSSDSNEPSETLICKSDMKAGDDESSPVQEANPVDANTPSRLMSLPNEIFIHIIKILCADSAVSLGRDEMDKLIKQLSSLSREFRDVVLNTPEFWSRIDNNYAQREGFEERLARSKNVPLTFHLNLGPETREGWDEVDEMLLRILPLRDRWKELHAKFWETAALVGAHHRNLEFPNVESLSLVFDLRDIPDLFFRSWKFPNCRTLEITDGFCPRPGLFTKLTSFELDDSYPKPRAIHRLMEFLASTPLLEDLSVSLGCDYLDTNVPGVTLPHLETLYISNRHDKTFDDDGWPGIGATLHLCYILQWLTMPKIEKIFLCLCLRSRKQLPKWIKQAGQVKEKLQHVTVFSLISRVKIDAAPLRDLLVLCPNTRELVLNAPEVAGTLQSLDSPVNLHNLRSVAFGGESREDPSVCKAALPKLTERRNHVKIQVMTADPKLSELAGEDICARVMQMRTM